jgi:hypothetical protein
LAAQNYQWQYLFFRGTTIAVVLLIYLMVREGGGLIITLKCTGISGLLEACGLVTAFAGFMVNLRWRKETPKFTTIALGGLLCSLLTLMILLFHNESPAMPIRNVYLSILHGSLVGLGLILFSVGAKFLPAAELALLSLIEVIAGVLWVYLPFFGVT